MKNEVFAGISLIFSVTAVVAQTPAAVPAAVAPAASGAAYSLDQFGPVGSPGDAQKTFEKASADIIAAGGGGVLLPAPTAAPLETEDQNQAEMRKPAAT